ncbi:hypothetical protein JYU34_007514 [Plutella xylostella]|uniref:Uncharacterized protein n=3 Tax=Plutella xylostella TaxID=51655 RepID=A0ABQ7QQM4_PLUXY|nr:syntaxin-1A isoform X1 [Plutella xylostella]KAG7307339.1 hypothetical protein JYU34_007514 [Plutella xylostella]CAG9097173.1 unnamed protein product [Plutella xylostella]
MRSKDRLSELQNIQNVSNNGQIYNETVEIYVHGEKNYEKDEIQNIFNEVDRMRAWIHDINGNTQLMRRLHADPTFHTNKHLQDQLDSVITQSNAIGLKICGALRQFESRASAKKNDVKARLSRLQYATTRQLYSDALTKHEQTLQMIKDAQYDLLQEQIRLTNLSISEEECQNLLETNNISLFVDNLQAETQEARLVLRDVEARHQELLRIEESLKDVKELFVQMSHLVAQQQDLIDTVEYYASQATEHVEYGGQELMKGTVSRKKARNKKVGLIVCLVSGFLLVLFVLIVT